MTCAVELKNCSLDNIKNKLENNSDQYKLIIKQELKTFDIKSNLDVAPYIRAVTEQYAEIKLLQNLGKKVKYTSDDIIEIMAKLDFIRLRVVTSNDDEDKIIEQSLWIKNYSKTKWLYKPLDLGGICEIIYAKLNMSNFNSVLSNLKGRLNSMSPDKGLFKLLNEPPGHIILTNNGIFNTETYTLITENEHNYDFINKLDYRILTPNQVDQNYYKTIKTLFNNWCDKDQNKVLYLKQVALATLDGKGRDCYHLIVSDKDNGKSTYLHMLEKLANGCFVNLNMDEVIKDNNLVNVNDSTKLIVGHELLAKSKLSDEVITRLKMLVAGEVFLINVRYKKVRLLRMESVKIQATNFLPKELKNKSILTDRLNIFEWSNVNQRQNLNLDLLLDDPDFIEAFIAWIFTDTGIFEEFIEIN